MQENPSPRRFSLTYPVGCSTDLRCALPHFAMICVGMVKAWGQSVAPNSPPARFDELLNALSGPQLQHVRESLGEGAQRELERLVQLLNEMSEHLEVEERSDLSGGGHA